MAVVYNAERLNALAARHWRSFSRQNYFDKQGIFTSALLSGPLLVIMFAQLVGRGGCGGVTVYGVGRASLLSAAVLLLGLLLVIMLAQLGRGGWGVTTVYMWVGGQAGLLSGARWCVW